MSQEKKGSTKHIVELMKRLSMQHGQHKHLITDQVIATFLEQKENSQLLTKVLSNPSDKNLLALDTAFREHYIEIRFIKYVSMILYYEAVHYDQRLRKRQERMILALDQPTGEKGENTLLEKVASYTPNLEDHSSLEEQVSSEELYRALLSLTPKQKMIIQFAYCDQLLDKDIAKKLGITQQAVSQSRRVALKKLKQAVGGVVR